VPYCQVPYYQVNAASFVHRSLASCLNLRGLHELTIQIFGNEEHFAEQMEALCPSGTVSGFRISVNRLSPHHVFLTGHRKPMSYSRGDWVSKEAA